ncbi:GGDEF domain-containing protein [Virgibacillus doumboii]|uniref:GGDEF domain-containing protein n=1 Tax=Virgibacillus doumboii TaxID=2697503 RepID=UPI0013DFD530|nr:sensor domain-containing diguanylate cyclase [Virgibacillus doumboii]
MVSKRKKVAIWVLWAIGWPLVLWFSYEYYYLNVNQQLIDIFLFALLMGIVAWFPITIKDNPIFFVNGISIAVFLAFGLFVEILLTLIAITIVFFKLRVGKKDSFRYPLNMLLFSVVSLTAAGVFRLLDGSHESIRVQSEEQILAIFGYAITIFIVNTLFNKLLGKFLYNRDVKIFDEGLRWELTSSLLIIPVGFVLFILYTEIGRAGIFYLGIPFVFISIILMLLYSYQEINRFLEKTGEIGHQLTKRMVLNEVYDVFIHEISDLMPIDYAYIYIVDGDKLQLERFHDVMQKSDPLFDSLERNEAFSGKVWADGEPLLYKQASEWSTVRSRKIHHNIESVLSHPVEYGNNTIGVVTVESNKKRAFEKLHFQILDILTNYLGVAVENAKNYELTKSQSEKDGLTQLYNYKYMENLLENHYTSLIQNGSMNDFSVLLLDLDYFKSVNDTYGHEAGNEVLCQVSERIKMLVGNQGVVARYGGEEFIVFLPFSGQFESTQIAEQIRTLISGQPFIVDKHMFDHNDEVSISVTVSIGVSVYPIHCETPDELIRHADRAMYIGAKRKGRNRVAVYEELKTN